MDNVNAHFVELPGLPGDGPAPVQFSSAGQGMHREGFVVEFHPASGARWVGNFQPGLTSFSTTLRHSDGHSVIVISGGQAYHVDPDSRALLGEFGAAIADVVPVPGRSMIIFSDGIRLLALQPSGFVWKTERISWDGIRALVLSRDHISGEACDPMKDGWTPFSVSLESGQTTGGSYTEYVA
jgi:hypothetical protein